MAKFYEPAEDSFFLLKLLEKEFEGKYTNRDLKDLNICEIGIGSGIIISRIAKKFPQNNYFGSDINEFAIENTKKKFGKNKIILKKNYLFEGFKNKRLNKSIKFDLVIFNTPYLPCEDGESYEELSLVDKAIYGGKKGNEIIFEFILSLNDFLKNNGEAIILYSSLSKPEEIEDILKKHLFEFEILKEENHFFEKLIVLRIWKNELLKILSSKKINNIKYLAVGKHSMVLEGKYKHKKVIIKTGKDEHIEKEAFFLDKLKKEKFLGHLIFKDKNFVVKEKVDGVIIKDFLENIENNNKRDVLKVLKNILDICFKLDKLRITKFEMTNPYKHIFIQKDLSVKMIDFERSIFSFTPKNTTQFLQYLIRNSPQLEKVGIKIDKKEVYSISKKYKTDWKKFKIEDIVVKSYKSSEALSRKSE